MVKLKKFVKKNAPELTLIGGLVAGGCSLYFSNRATAKAVRILDKKREEKGEALTVKETVETVGKDYIPAIAATAASLALLIASNRISNKRYLAVLGSLGTLAANASEIAKATEEVVGKEKAQEIRDKVAEKQIKDIPEEIKKQLKFTGGKCVCKESLTGQYFDNNEAGIQAIADALNSTPFGLYFQKGRLEFNEWLEAIGCKPCDLGDRYEWIWQKDGDIQLIFGAGRDEQLGISYLIVDYFVAPKVYPHRGSEDYINWHHRRAK